MAIINETIVVNDIFQDLREENNRLLSQLFFAQKCIQLLNNYRNCLISSNNNCKCDQNINNKIVFNLLENEYKSIFNNDSGIGHQIKLLKETNTNDKNKLNHKINCLNKVTEESSACVQNQQQTNSTNHSIHNKSMVHIIDNNTEDKLQLKQTEIHVSCSQSNDQIYSDSNEDKNNGSDCDINESIVNEKIESKKKLSINELMRKIEKKQVSTEIDKNNQFIKVFRLKQEENESSGHRVIGYGCNWTECGYVNCKRYLVITHIMTNHTLEKPFTCDVCQFKTISRRHLSLHKQNIHKFQVFKSYKCDWNECQYETVDKKYIEEHKKRHKTIKSYVCVWPSCELSFCTSSQLKAHVNNIHSDSRPYRCDWPGCESAFKQASNLRAHKLIHSAVKPIECDWPQCQKTFRSKHDLRKHKLVHKGVKKFVCDWPQCGKRFRDGFNLRQHLMVHRDERPIKCLINGCDKRFRANWLMINHLKTHDK